MDTARALTNGITVWALVPTLLAAAPAGAVDGGAVAAGGEATYYSENVGPEWSGEEIQAPDQGLPGGLYVVEAEGGVSYTRLNEAGGLAEWEVRIEVAERPHERVDSVYDLVLALPLPYDEASGRALFSASQLGITAREGAPGQSVPLVYGGEKLVLKRNVALERTWLSRLVGAPDGLPDLAGSGYAYTLWDAIVRYDRSRSGTIQGWGTLRYTTRADVTPPDPADARQGAYLMTWIPTLDPTVPPFSIRLDAVEVAAP